MYILCSLNFYNFRADIVEDTGASISQAVDIGQVEGAFVMGMGLWTSEKISFEASTGRLLTDDTWVILIDQVVS